VRSLRVDRRFIESLMSHCLVCKISIADADAADGEAIVFVAPIKPQATHISGSMMKAAEGCGFPGRKELRRPALILIDVYLPQVPPEDVIDSFCQ
jgi:hypothetical protein